MFAKVEWRSAYCQVIREANKVKRLEWAIENKTAALNDGFKDVMWTDKCSIQVETLRRFCCRKRGLHNHVQNQGDLLFKVYFHCQINNSTVIL